MIEKYFIPGVRLKWVKPRDFTGGAMDGSLVDCPAGQETPMIYDGMDGELQGFSPVNVTALGFRMNMPISYSWLSYAPGRTARRMRVAGDMLTGYMSGCLITDWSENGMRYVGHIGTIDGNAVVNARVKSAFAGAMPSQTRGFNPAGAWTRGEITPLMLKFKGGAQERIFALVTSSGDYYAILMFLLVGKPNEWCVGGIKKVPPMNRAALHAHLTRP